MRLKDLFQVKSRFHRSVQIELDSVLDDYIITQSVVKILDRVAESLVSKYSTKAWTITGPYGSGKSAFIVYLKLLLGDGNAVAVNKARELLKKTNKNLYIKLFESNPIVTKSQKRFCTLLVSAGRERVEKVILKGLLSGLNSFYEHSRTQSITQKIEDTIHKCDQGYFPTNDLIIELLEETFKHVVKSKAAGLLFVIDELGKCLEAASLNQNSDIFILQKLAETASRSEKYPFLFFTVLHQPFDRYASRLDSEKRSEWAKIQGRFEDIPFVDSSEQVYKIISSAIDFSASGKKHKQVLELNTNVFESFSKLFKDNHNNIPKHFVETLQRCLPLHPLSTTVLVPLFRSKFAQNERSLFAFITSMEPGSFSDFLSRTEVNVQGSSFPLYSIYHLYDYLIANFGVSLFTYTYGKKWIEIDQALGRSTDDLERKIIKTIGILSLLSENLGFSINEDAISCAIGTDDNGKQQAVSNALESLCRKSVIVFRRYSSSYVLWGGSDIDIEQKINETKQSKISKTNLVEMLNKLFPLRPKIAKRYFYEKGTLRYFNIRYVDASNLTGELQKEIENADGQILLVINRDNDTSLTVTDVQEVLNKANKDISQRTLIGFASNAERVSGVFTELLALQWIQKNTPELQGDQIAQREIDARILQMERMVSEATSNLFYTGNLEADVNTFWIDSEINKPKATVTKKELSTWISDICDRVFYNTPILKNELINRTYLSSNISAARKKLLHAMLENSQKENLGIQGFPPEYCIYQSVFAKSGLHKKVKDNNWRFDPDAEHFEKSWQPIWEELTRYLTEREDQKVPVTELMSIMRNQPFGIKEGIIPLILATFLIAYDTEIALFEQGTFKPVIKPTDFDLLCKVPHRFAIQLCRITGIKAIVFEQLMKTLVKKHDDIKSSKVVNILNIVKMLCSFVNSLPLYVQKTENLSTRAKAVRKVLLEALEPANLLYKDIPVACGFKPITNKIDPDEIQVKEFVVTLKNALIELQRKEAELFGKIENILLHTFSLQDASGDFRNLISERAQRIMSITLDPIIKAFLVRVVDNLEHKAWLDSIGTFITRRPPLNWVDDDLLRFEQEMAAMSAKITRYERLALEKGDKTLEASDELIQISITSDKKAEIFKLIHLNQNKKEQIKMIQESFCEVFKGLSHHGDIDLILGALSKFTEQIIEDYKVVDQK